MLILVSMIFVFDFKVLCWILLLKNTKTWWFRTYQIYTASVFVWIRQRTYDVSKIIKLVKSVVALVGEVVKQLSYSWAVAYITGTPSFYVLRTLTNSQVCNKGFVTKKKSVIKVHQLIIQSFIHFEYKWYRL